MSEHTPTPWVLRHSEPREWAPEPRPERIIGPNGDPLWVACIGMSTDPEAVANAAFIVKAVNSHETLVAELRRLHEICGHQTTADLLAVVGESST